MRAKSIVACLVLLLAAFASGSNAGESIVARMDGIIGPSSAKFMVEAIERAEERGAECVVFEIDTPGGLDESMRDDREEDHDLESAGRRLRRAVGIAGRFRGGLHHDGGARGGHGSGHQHRRGPSGLHRHIGAKVDSVMAGKMVNDAAAYVRSIAGERGRNAALGRGRRQGERIHLRDGGAEAPRDRSRSPLPSKRFSTRSTAGRSTIEEKHGHPDTRKAPRSSRWR